MSTDTPPLQNILELLVHSVLLVRRFLGKDWGSNIEKKREEREAVVQLSNKFGNVGHIVCQGNDVIDEELEVDFFFQFLVNRWWRSTSFW